MDAEDREQALAETRFAHELRQQFEALAQRAPQPRRRRGMVVTAVAVGAAVAALLGGVALAGGFSSDPAKLPKPPLPAESVYPTNASGQTYGSEKSLVEAPDLIAAMATNGKRGYCLKSDINPQPTPTNTPMTPEEAEAMMDAGLRGHTIPVYESDGVTQIGVLQMGGPGTRTVYGTPDGSDVTKTVDEDGNIITTTVAPDGTTTIETKALDGTVTTKTLTAAEAARLKETPAPTPKPSHVPDKPAWLLDRMSSLARDAGDAHATARWELQTRYYLKRIDGENWPTSEYAQWEDVWLIIMHGDFRSGAWRYWLLDPDSHNIVSQGQSNQPFDTSSHSIQPMEGPVTLGGD